jgi:hypothetical protein
MSKRAKILNGVILTLCVLATGYLEKLDMVDEAIIAAGVK